jgi:hypothetical protein
MDSRDMGTGNDTDHQDCNTQNCPGQDNISLHLFSLSISIFRFNSSVSKLLLFDTRISEASELLLFDTRISEASELLLFDTRISGVKQ